MTRLTEWSSDAAHSLALSKQRSEARAFNLQELQAAMRAAGAVALEARVPGPHKTPLVEGSLRFLDAQGRPLAIGDGLGRIKRVFTEASDRMRPATLMHETEVPLAKLASHVAGSFVTDTQMAFWIEGRGRPTLDLDGQAEVQVTGPFLGPNEVARMAEHARDMVTAGGANALRLKASFERRALHANLETLRALMAPVRATHAVLVIAVDGQGDVGCEAVRLWNGEEPIRAMVATGHIGAMRVEVGTPLRENGPVGVTLDLIEAEPHELGAHLAEQFLAIEHPEALTSPIRATVNVGREGSPILAVIDHAPRPEACPV